MRSLLAILCAARAAATDRPANPLVEALEDRRMLSVNPLYAAGARTASVSTLAVKKGADISPVPKAVATTPVNFLNTYEGVLNTRLFGLNGVPRKADFIVRVTAQNASSGWVTGTINVENLGDMAFSGTVKGRRLTATFFGVGRGKIDLTLKGGEVRGYVTGGLNGSKGYGALRANKVTLSTSGGAIAPGPKETGNTGGTGGTGSGFNTGNFIGGSTASGGIPFGTLDISNGGFTVGGTFDISRPLSQQGLGQGLSSSFGNTTIRVF